MQNNSDNHSMLENDEIKLQLDNEADESKEENFQYAPPEYCCPIYKTIMKEPVILVEDGHTYEKDAIQWWFDIGKRTSPITNLFLKDKTLKINYKLFKEIEKYKDECRENIKNQLTGVTANLNDPIGTTHQALFNDRSQCKRISRTTAFFISDLKEHMRIKLPNLTFDNNAEFFFVGKTIQYLSENEEPAKTLEEELESFDIPSKVIRFIRFYTRSNTCLTEIKDNQHFGRQLLSLIRAHDLNGIKTMGGLLEEQQHAVEEVEEIQENEANTGINSWFSWTKATL